MTMPVSSRPTSAAARPDFSGIGEDSEDSQATFLAKASRVMRWRLDCLTVVADQLRAEAMSHAGVLEASHERERALWAEIQERTKECDRIQRDFQVYEAELRTHIDAQQQVCDRILEDAGRFEAELREEIRRQEDARTREAEEARGRERALEARIAEITSGSAWKWARRLSGIRRLATRSGLRSRLRSG